MSGLALATPLAAAILLVPALALAALAALMRDAPAEWGTTGLLVWTSLAAALLVGGCLQSGSGPLAWAALAAGFVAVMVGGPPGLAMAALAILVLALPGSGLPAARWLPVGLGVIAALVALRRFLA